MFCKYCGKELAHGTTVCTECSEGKAQAKAKEEAVAEEVVIEQTETTETKNQPANPDLTEAPAPKKAKTGLIVAVAAAVVAVVLAALVFLNFSAVKGLWIKTFATEAEYFSYVEMNAIGEQIGTAMGLYGTATDNLDLKSMNTSTEISVEIGDDAVKLLKDAVPALKEASFDSVKKISLVLDSSATTDKQSMDLKLKVGDNTLLDIGGILDGEGKDAYLAIRNLSEKYLMFEDVLVEAGYDISEIDLDKMSEALPTDANLKKLFTKYVEIVINKLGEVEMSSETITVGNYSQKVTVLEYEFTEENFYDICVAVLAELEKDQDVKAIIDRMETYLYEEFPEAFEGMEKGELYDAFHTAVDETLDSFGDIELGDTVFFTLVDYVNSNHEIIGREISVEGDTVLSYLSAYKGKKFATEIKIPEAELEIFGEGTDKNDVVTATYTVEVEGTKAVEVSLEKFDLGSMKEGKPNGVVTVSPAKSLLSEFSEAGTAVSALQPAVKLTFATTTHSAKMSVDLLSKGQNFVTITIASKKTSGDKITVPSEDAVMSGDDVFAWANTFDLDKLVEAIEKIDLPKDIMDMVDQYVAEIKEAGGVGVVLEALFSGYSDENYYEDDLYGDYYEDDDYGDYYEDDDYGDYYDDYFDEESSDLFIDQF